VTGDSQARICERLGVKFPGPTRPGLSNRSPFFSAHVCHWFVFTADGDRPRIVGKVEPNSSTVTASWQLLP
jgi:hypothetical protein